MASVTTAGFFENSAFLNLKTVYPAASIRASRTASRVSRLVQIMHPAIQFDHKLDLMAGEVGDGARHRRLPPELQPIQLSITQHGPKDRLRACHVGAKAA